MEDKYVYGYNIWGNEENNYLNSINTIMEKYDEQSKQVLKVVDSFNKNVQDINKNTRITDEQIRIWYNEDYSLNNSLVSFESYKKSILEMIKQTNFNLDSELLKKLDEYYANDYYLINIKNDTKNKLNKKSNELELILLEQKNLLDLISVELSRKKKEYDRNGNLINSDEFIELRDRYDNAWLEIKKIKNALIHLKDMLKKIDLKEDEIELLRTGLSTEQQNIYEKIIVSFEEKNNKPVNNSSKKSEEIKEMIDYLKSIKKDLTEEEIKEIENFLIK